MENGASFELKLSQELSDSQSSPRNKKAKLMHEDAVSLLTEQENQNPVETLLPEDQTVPEVDPLHSEEQTLPEVDVQPPSQTEEQPPIPTERDQSSASQEPQISSSLAHSGESVGEERVIPKNMKMLRFYLGLIPSAPHGALIDQILDDWYYDYGLLEKHHSYIQWIFPTFEESMVNDAAPPLQKAEAKFIRESSECAFRVLRAYKMMLNFYGLRLVDLATGEVDRAEEGFWQARFLNLNQRGHNNLRINRILTSLGQLGFSKYKQPLLDRFTYEVQNFSHLNQCRRSLVSFWSETVLVNTKKYRQKTLEEPEDRTDSIFFQLMQNNSEEYQKFLDAEQEHDEQFKAVKERANEATIRKYQQHLTHMGGKDTYSYSAYSRRF